MFTQKIRGPAAYDHGVPFLSDLIHDLLHHRHHAVSVEDLTAKSSGVALVTAAPESLGETVEAAIHAFVATHDGGRFDVRETGDFFGETLIPDFPSQSLGQPGSDGTPAATVFALDGQDPKHDV